MSGERVLLHETARKICLVCVFRASSKVKVPETKTSTSERTCQNCDKRMWTMGKPTQACHNKSAGEHTVDGYTAG